jgi:hypothetical protein
MNTPINLDEVISCATQLPPDQFDMLIEILRRRQVESRREEIAAEAVKAIKSFKEGRLQSAGISETLQSLHASSED